MIDPIRHAPARARRRGFTLVELMLVAGLVALFALVVVPGLASARIAPSAPVARILEADLRRARTEAIASALPVAVVASADGDAWWLAFEPQLDAPIDGTLREFGRGALVDYRDVRLAVANAQVAGSSRAIARFDALGARDEGVPMIALRGGAGEEFARWELPAGRTRLAPTSAESP